MAACHFPSLLKYDDQELIDNGSLAYHKLRTELSK